MGLTPRVPAGQGEAVATWALWALVLGAIVVTYSRLEPSQLYNVSRDGFDNGFSRALVETNFPISLVAIALTLIALDVLPRRTWLAGAPAIILCAVTAWPGVVEQDDLDAAPVNFVPAVGVAVAVSLTIFAARRTGVVFAPRRPLDLARIVLAVATIVLSIPWLAAELGFFLPDGVFLMERLGREPDGTVLAAVHLGHHHGLDGAALILSALLLSRVRMVGRRLGIAVSLYLALMFAYGTMNLAEDLWHEQVVKRGWVDWKIPAALEPRLEAVWLVTIVLAIAAAVLLRREAQPEATAA